MARKPTHVTINLRASRAFVEALEAAASKLECSKSEFMRRACLEQLRRDRELIEQAA